jgi:hypothetical protein
MQEKKNQGQHALYIASAGRGSTCSKVKVEGDAYYVSGGRHFAITAIATDILTQLRPRLGRHCRGQKKKASG